MDFMMPMGMPKLPNGMPNPMMSQDFAAVGKVKFEMKFNASRGIDQPFTAWIFYDRIKDIPFKMEFMRFEHDADARKASMCSHSCAQNRKVRFFIKNVPPEIQPFSLKLTVCPDCGAPVEYQFIVYPGGLGRYPKVRDVDQYQSRIIDTTGEQKRLPRAVECEQHRMKIA